MLKDAGEIMNILEAFDLVGSYRGAAELAGCDHHTVKHYVQRRDAGLAPGDGLVRASIIDEFRDKIDELVERSSGKIRADVVHDRLVAMGYTGGLWVEDRVGPDAQDCQGQSPADRCASEPSRYGHPHVCARVHRRPRWPSPLLRGFPTQARKSSRGRYPAECVAVEPVQERAFFDGVHIAVAGPKSASWTSRPSTSGSPLSCR